MSTQFKRPCVQCGKLSLNGTRCETCDAPRKQREEERKKLRKRQTGQYSGDYRRRAKAVREAAVTCHICGEGAKDNDPWHADHVIPADPSSPLAPAHKSCNESRGNKPL